MKNALQIMSLAAYASETNKRYLKTSGSIKEGKVLRAEAFVTSATFLNTQDK